MDSRWHVIRYHKSFPFRNRVVVRSASEENSLKKTMIAASLLLLLVPLTTLTTILASTSPDSVRVRDGCFDVAIYPSTIPEGTPSIRVTGTDTCFPPGSQIGSAVKPIGVCDATQPNIIGPVYTLTDASSKFALDLPTSTLTPTSYCVKTWDIHYNSNNAAGVGYGVHTLTVTPGTPPPSGACLAASIYPTTITEGTSSIEVRGQDTCDPASTQIGVSIRPSGDCYSGTIFSSVWAETDASLKFDVNVPTSALSAGSYCVHAATVGGTIYSVDLTLTVTGGTPPPPSGVCFEVSIYPSTVTEGTEHIMVSGTNNCDPPGSQVGVAVYLEGACLTTPLQTPIFVVTDSASKFSIPFPTSTLGAGSYCVGAWGGSGSPPGSGNDKKPLTVTTGTPPPAGGFDFTLAFSPSTRSVTAGGAANFPILVTFSDPSYSTTTINVAGVSGLGAGMNYQIISTPPALSISTSPSTPTGTYTITLTGSAMGVTRHASAVLTVQGAQQAFDFSIGISPLDQIVNTGGSTTCTVTVNLVSGTTQSVALTVPDAPSGVTVTFSTPSGSPTFTSTLTISASQSASPGKYAVTVTGIGGGKTHTLPVALIIEASPDFQVEVDPPSQSVPQGQNAKYVVHVAGSNGFNSQVSLTVDGLPAGVNGVFDVPSSSPDFTTTLTLTIPSNSPTGSFTLTITGSGGGTSRVANAVLMVNPTAQTQSPTQTQTQTQTQATTQPGGGTSSANDLLGMIQQNSLLVIGILAIVIVLVGVLALRARKPSSAPTPPTQAQVSPFTCSACGTQNPVGNDFCANCGRRLQ